MAAVGKHLYHMYRPSSTASACQHVIDGVIYHTICCSWNTVLQCKGRQGSSSEGEGKLSWVGVVWGIIHTPFIPAIHYSTIHILLISFPYPTSSTTSNPISLSGLSIECKIWSDASTGRLYDLWSSDGVGWDACSHSEVGLCSSERKAFDGRLQVMPCNFIYNIVRKYY